MPEFFSTSFLTPASLFLLLNLMIATIVITSRYTTNRKTEAEKHRPPPLVRAPSLIDRVKSINLSFQKFSPFDSETTSDHPINGYTAGVDHPPPLERAPSLLERLKSVKFSSLIRSDPDSEPNPEPDFAGGFEAVHHEVKRSQSEKETAGVDHPPALERAPSLLERLKSVNFSSLYRPDPVPEPKLEPELARGLERSKSEKAAAPARKEAEEMRKSASEKGVLVDEVEERERGEGRRAETVRLGKTASFGDDGVDAKADDFINRFKQQLKLQRLDSLLRYRDMLRGK